MLDYDIKSAVPEASFNIQYRKLLIKVWLVGLMTVLAFIFGLNNFTSKDNAIWFQRSGSLIVAFSLFSQHLYLKLVRMVSEQMVDYGENGIATRVENFKRKNLPLEYSDPTLRILHEPLIIFSGLVGTIIWGYGDLICRITCCTGF